MKLCRVLHLRRKRVIDANNRNICLYGQRKEISAMRLGGLRDEPTAMNVKNEPWGSGRGRGFDKGWAGHAGAETG
jgi:hypothetical protein